jgi:uroporphyrinogen-III synthase
MMIAHSSPPEAGPSLAGRGVVITRPREQSVLLSELVKAAAGRPIVFPALEIVDTLDTRALRVLIDRLDRFHFAVFISPTAVNRAMNLIRARRELPAGLRVAAIGKGSARELKRLGVEQVLVPEGRFDSEALLALPQFADVTGRSVVIFRGEGGRELLGDTLTQRGAEVEYAECYRRTRPNGDAQMLLRAWARGEIDAVTVTSGEALRNLYDMVGTLGRHWLRKTPLFASHERIAAAARELGIVQAVVAEAGDEGLVAAMLRYFAASP